MGMEFCKSSYGRGIEKKRKRQREKSIKGMRDSGRGCAPECYLAMRACARL